MLRLLEELLWSLRRKGLVISPAQAIDAVRAASLVGFGDRALLREAIAAVVVTREEQRVVFEAVFDRFFSADAAHERDLSGRLRGQGLDDETVRRALWILEVMAEQGGPSGDAARLLMAASRGAALGHMLMGGEARRILGGLSGPMQVGFFAQKLIELVGLRGASRALGQLRLMLEGELGAELGAKVAEALERELVLARGEIRRFVEQQVEPREVSSQSVREAPFTALDEGQVEEVRRAVRVLAERLRGAARIKERHAREGRFDARRTLRAAMRTGGVPVRPAFKQRRRDKPRLLVLCDVSDSVRTASIFLLEFLAVAQELFERTRTFVFVSELREATAIFADKPLAQAMAEVFGGGVVNLTHNSNYGSVLRQFEQAHGRELDRRSTVVMLGDGRTNFQPPEVEVLSRLRERARAVYWLCPEPRGGWGTGDSQMPRYAKASTKVFVASSAAELEAAARALLVQR